MERTTTPELVTLRELDARYGVGLKRVRYEARRGSFPVYTAGTKWWRARPAEFEHWLASTRVPATPHAEARVAEILEERRQRDGGGP